MTRVSSMPPASRILIRQASATDLESIVRVCAQRIDNWRATLPPPPMLSEFFSRALSKQDDVFQFWVAENGYAEVVGWEMLAPFSTDPARRRLTAEATMCLGSPHEQLGRMLSTHAIRHASRTSLQYLFAQVPTIDELSLGVLEALGYEEVGVIPSTSKGIGQPERVEFVYVL